MDKLLKNDATAEDRWYARQVEALLDLIDQLYPNYSLLSSVFVGVRRPVPLQFFLVYFFLCSRYDLMHADF